MSEKKDKNNKEISIIERIGLMMLKSIKEYLIAVKCGFKRVDFKDRDNLVIIFMLNIIFIASIIYSPIYPNILNYIWPAVFTEGVIEGIKSANKYTHSGLFLGLFWSLVLFVIGLKEYGRRRRILRGINNLGFENRDGTRPTIHKIIDNAYGHSKIVLNSGGFAASNFKSKLGNLTATLGERVEDAVMCEEDVTKVNLYTARKPLPVMFTFSEAKRHLSKDFHFVPGISYKGVVTEDITDLPHLFIAGATGGGKSMCLNSLLISLMHSKTRSQYYFFDFKEGVEASLYKGFPNLEICTTEQKALELLTELRDEMDKRHAYLAEKGFKKINPKRDKKDRIIIAFDEVSELFNFKVRCKETRELRENIFDQVHELAKKSRAAGFNLIFATQKIQKTTLPTEIQSNLGGRLAYRMESIPDSINAIGNKMANDMPAVKGRCIWRKGGVYTEVQAPFMSNNEMIHEIEFLRKRFEGVHKGLPYKMVSNDNYTSSKPKKSPRNKK